MKHYLLYMVFLLGIPALAANYVYPVLDFFRDTESDGNGDRAWAVWLVFLFAVWMTHTNFQNNAAKWRLCTAIDQSEVLERFSEECEEASE